MSVGVFNRQIGTSGGGLAAASTAEVITNTGASLPAGSLVVVQAGARGATVTIGVTDSAGNTYKAAGSQLTSSNVTATMFYSVLTNPLPTNGTISISRSASVSMACTAEAWSGLTGVIEAGAVILASSVTSGSVTDPDDLLVGQQVFSSNATPTQDSSWTNFAATASIRGGSSTTSFVTLVGGYRNAGATGTFTYHPTGGTNTVITKIVAFKPSVSGVVASARAAFGVPI